MKYIVHLLDSIVRLMALITDVGGEMVAPHHGHVTHQGELTPSRTEMSKTTWIKRIDGISDHYWPSH